MKQGRREGGMQDRFIAHDWRKNKALILWKPINGNQIYGAGKEQDAIHDGPYPLYQNLAQISDSAKVSIFRSLHIP